MATLFAFSTSSSVESSKQLRHTIWHITYRWGLQKISSKCSFAFLRRIRSVACWVEEEEEVEGLDRNKKLKRSLVKFWNDFYLFATTFRSLHENICLCVGVFTTHISTFDISHREIKAKWRIGCEHREHTSEEASHAIVASLLELKIVENGFMTWKYHQGNRSRVAKYLDVSIDDRESAPESRSPIHRNQTSQQRQSGEHFYIQMSFKIQIAD